MKSNTCLLTASLLFAVIFAQGQSVSLSSFESFAKEQNTLFVAAYQKKDIAVYNTLTNTFLKRYEGLSKEEQKQFAPYYVNAYYNLSCAYAILDKKKEAVASLDKAIKSGYANYAHIQEDSDLDNLRKDASFQATIAPLREVGDYLYILKKDNRFTKTDSIEIPAFSYQPATHPALVRLREQFKLDSIAGTGNEASRLINVLQWVHHTVPHDGQHESGIQQINGMEIASVATTRKIGVSCGELATLLNDCYLALGFKSRKVYCLPKDSLNMDYDSHVINAVYSGELKKWLWMDPTHGAYVMNEKGELLSMEEVRARLVNDQPLILNPDANWNRQVSTVKSRYLYSYMAKNLYRFYCPLNSEFDIETRGREAKVSYVNLVPAGYGKFRERPARTESYNQRLKTTFVHYTTHNPARFWQAPE